MTQIDVTEAQIKGTLLALARDLMKGADKYPTAEEVVKYAQTLADFVMPQPKVTSLVTPQLQVRMGK